MNAVQNTKGGWKGRREGERKEERKGRREERRLRDYTSHLRSPGLLLNLNKDTIKEKENIVLGHCSIQMAKFIKTSTIGISRY